MLVDRIFHKINSSKSHPYFYLSPHVYSFGDCAEEIHYGLIKAMHNKKKLVILYPFDIPFIFKYKLTNRALFNIKSNLIAHQGKYLTIFGRILMTIIYMPIRVAGLLLRKFSRFNLPDSYHFPEIGTRYIYVPENSIKKFSLESVQKYNWKEKYNTKIDFTINLHGKVHNGYEHLKIGVPENSWFVCLHVRGSGFRNDKGRRDYRNPSILNYIPAIKKITSRGGWVVRMGDNTMKPLPSMKNVIDYPFTRYKSDFMDLCLIQNCRFFIGGQSGLDGIARLAHKNLLHINISNWRLEPKRIRDRGILQRVYSKKDKRFLSIKELLLIDLKEENTNLFYGLNDQHKESENYVLTENSEGEISSAVVEYMDFLTNNKLSLTSKQKEFNEYHKKQVQRLLKNNQVLSNTLNPGSYSDEDKIIKRYIAAAQVELRQGNICAGFLEEHW
jgi:putative glycosyltransferase (TIGR04372 family)